MSYIFALLIIAGYLAVISKAPIGFITQFIGCLGMINLYWGLDGGVVLVNAVFAVVNVYGYLKWEKYI